MKKFVSAILIISFTLACRLTGAPAPASMPAAPPAEVPEGITLQEAWQLAGPTVQEWATDAQMSEEFACQGVLTPDGRCNRWYGVLVSATQNKVAELVVVPDRVVRLSPATAPVGRYLDAAFSLEGMRDSSQAARGAWTWLEAQGLRKEGTRLRGLALRASPGVTQECGVSPAYYVSFSSPQGRLCLDPYGGQVTGNTYGR